MFPFVALPGRFAVKIFYPVGVAPFDQNPRHKHNRSGGFLTRFLAVKAPLEELALQFDFVLARDVGWQRVWRIYPYTAVGNNLALEVGEAPISKDIYVGPLPLSDILAAESSPDWGEQTVRCRKLS